MTHEEAIILSAYTGVSLVKDFSEVHEYIEKMLGRAVFPYELVRTEVWYKIREKLWPKVCEMFQNDSDAEQKENRMFGINGLISANRGIKTNGEYIRTLSDEELADQLVLEIKGIAPCNMFASIPTGKMFIARNATRKDVEKWLKMPVEDVEA